MSNKPITVDELRDFCRQVAWKFNLETFRKTVKAVASGKRPQHFVGLYGNDSRKDSLHAIRRLV